MITPARDASAARTSSFGRAKRPPRAADIEVLYDKLPEPIDLDLDLESRRFCTGPTEAILRGAIR